jgi:hypothetical protein
MLPLSGLSSVPMQLSKVVFPEPDLPTRMTPCPSSTKKEMPARAVTRPRPEVYRLETSWIETMDYTLLRISAGFLPMT